jgi:Lon protease-like protein
VALPTWAWTMSTLTIHPTSLPLFPLGTVLFPGGLLPLRIFEVRYLDMIGNCYRAGAPFGVVTLSKGSEVRQPDPDGTEPDACMPEAFHAVGTLARITELSTPQAGLMVVRCEGTHRFRIHDYQKLKYGLWQAKVETLEDDLSVPIPDDLQGVANALSNLIHTLKVRKVPEQQMPMLLPYKLDDCGWVANRWCEQLPMPLQQRQRLMALDNPLVRLELVNDMLLRSGIVAKGARPD